MSEPSKNLQDTLDFCPGCFASSEDGSWGATVIDDLCTNCGSYGTVKLPRWAVDSIRKSASWVGKRYYPSQEDHETQRELAYLRSIAPDAGVEVEKMPDSNRWFAKRGNTTIYSYDTAEEARTKGTRSLRYPVPEDFK